MPKISKAPSGLYTASEAIKKLNMPQATFHYYVKTGKIKRVMPPGRSEGYYEKAYIDQMAEANQLFAIQYASQPTTFSVATTEDLEGIYRVMVSFWGSLYVPTVEERLSWYKVNPQIDYVVKKENIVTGYVTLLPLKSDTMKKLMNGEIGTKNLTPPDILPFSPDTPLDCWVGIAVKPGVYQPEKYAIRLLMGILKVMEELAKKGIVIKRLWAKSETPDGIRLCSNLGFTELEPESNKLPRKFVLDLETTDLPQLKQYKRVVTANKNGNTTTKKRMAKNRSG